MVHASGVGVDVGDNPPSPWPPPTRLDDVGVEFASAAIAATNEGRETGRDDNRVCSIDGRRRRRRIGRQGEFHFLAPWPWPAWRPGALAWPAPWRPGALAEIDVEEGADDPRRHRYDRVWIVDPLDGTRVRRGCRNDWAVHVALWERGSLTAGAVALPAMELTLATDPPPASPTIDRTHPVVVTSRSRPSFVAAIAAEAINADVIQLGSAGAKAMAVVTGIADVYAHAGGMYQWDSAAPAAVAMAAGLHVSRIDGSPIIYNEPDLWLPDFLVCREPYASPVLAAIDKAWQEWRTRPALA